MQKRIVELDSIRGLAALTVMFGHILNVTPPPKFLWYNPVRILWAGHEAVIMFFILSGFVLSLPFLSDEKVNYPKFLIKRITRIYLPYLVAITFTILLRFLFFKGSIKDLGWANNFWSQNIDFNLILNHILLITNFKTDVLNPVVWSLIHEMRISVIFPLLMIIALRLKWTHTLFLGMIFTAIGFLNQLFQVNVSQGFLTSYADTVHYASMFLIGILIAKHRTLIVGKYKELGTFKQLTIFLAGWGFYSLSIIFDHFFHTPLIMYVQEWFIALGASLIILVSLASKKVAGFLLTTPVQFLGKISYSLYLYHLPILIASLYFFNKIVPVWIIFIIAVSLSLIIATISWYYVERYSIKLGRSLTKRNFKKDKLSETA